MVNSFFSELWDMATPVVEAAERMRKWAKVDFFTSAEARAIRTAFVEVVTPLKERLAELEPREEKSVVDGEQSTFGGLPVGAEFWFEKGIVSSLVSMERGPFVKESETHYVSRKYPPDHPTQHRFEISSPASAVLTADPGPQRR